jgi:UDP-N-acetylmuramoyl-tripeptide--D-alanyl-D-alanine ligase
MGFLFPLHEALGPLSGSVVFGSTETRFGTYCIDSRYATEGSMFVPLLGQHRDGHHFIIDAFQGGATVSLVRRGHHLVPEIIRAVQESQSFVSRQLPHDVSIVEVRHTLVALQKLASWFRRNFSEVKVIGVSGSVGKTQTKEMALTLLSSRFKAVGTDKNFNNEIGVPLTLSKLGPDVHFAVIEMAMRGRGEISLLSRIAQPNVSLITNTLGSHIGRLGSRTEVVRAKAEIIDGMKPGDTLWLNADDVHLNLLMHEIEQKQALSRGLQLKFFDASAAAQTLPPIGPLFIPAGDDEAALPPYPKPKPEVWVEDVVYQDINGSVFTLYAGGDKREVSLRLPGRGAVENLTCAAAITYNCGLELSEIAELVGSLTPTPQRLTPYMLVEGVILIDDSYNSSPASTLDALEVLAQLSKRARVIAVLGDMLELGRFDAVYHQEAARQLLRMKPALAIGIGPRMAALQDVEAAGSTELLWFHGHSEENDRLARGFPPSANGLDDDSDGRTEMVDRTTIARIAERLLQEIRSSDDPTVILVKGSRALHLERVVADVLGYFGKEAAIL